MNIGYAEWREGIGYDLDALRELNQEELVAAEDLVVARQLSDWRDIDALDRIGSPRALAEVDRAVRADSHEVSLDVRIRAATRLFNRGLLSAAAVESLVLRALEHATLLNGLSSTLELAAAHPTVAVRERLLWCALNGNEDMRVHAAALADYLHGGSTSAFDWNFRPLYLRFKAEDPQLRRVAYADLCQKIGINPRE